MATNRRSPVLGRVFDVRALRWLGTISYGLYLWHWPVYLVLNEGRTGASGVVLLAMRLAVSLAIAWLSFHLLEQPVRQGALRRPIPRILAPVGAVAAFGALLVATSGAVDPGAVNQLAAPAQAAQRIPGAPTVMVVGDSVGNSMAGPLIDDPWSYGINPVNQAVIGCELMFRATRSARPTAQCPPRPDCTAGYRDAVATYQPNVVLVFFGGANSGEVVIDGTATTACDPAFQAEQERLHRDAIDDLSSSGATVALVTLARTDDTAFFPPPWNENIGCYNDVLRTVAASTGAEVVDLDQWLCPDGACKAKVDGAPVRPDGLHFNGPGGRAVAQHLVDEGLRLADLEPAATAAKVPPECAELRHGAGPVLDLIGGTSDDARRSSLDRLPVRGPG